MKIITVNTNPAYDIFYRVPEFKQYKENLAESVSAFTGGKGINVTRALNANGIVSTAYILLGNQNSQAFTDGISSDGIDARLFFNSGRIRENITFLSDGSPETRVSVNSFYANFSDLEKMLDTLSSEKSEKPIIICSGKLPNGITSDEAMEFVRGLKKISEKVVLDSNTFNAKQILELSPWLIKPNEEELETLYGRSITDADGYLAAVERLHQDGITNVLVTLGKNGAIYCGELGKCIAEVPKIQPLSTVGAGDSTVAGFVAAYASGDSLTDCIKTACAFGTAACLSPGTKPPTPENIAHIRGMINIKIL